MQVEGHWEQGSANKADVRQMCGENRAEEEHRWKCSVEKMKREVTDQKPQPWLFPYMQVWK